jgi:hypothetical protein
VSQIFPGSPLIAILLISAGIEASPPLPITKDHVDSSEKSGPEEAKSPTDGIAASKITAPVVDVAHATFRTTQVLFLSGLQGVDCAGEGRVTLTGSVDANASFEIQTPPSLPPTAIRSLMLG